MDLKLLAISKVNRRPNVPSSSTHCSRLRLVSVCVCIWGCIWGGGGRGAFESTRVFQTCELLATTQVEGLDRLITQRRDVTWSGVYTSMRIVAARPTSVVRKCGRMGSWLP